MDANDSEGCTWKRILAKELFDEVVFPTVSPYLLFAAALLLVLFILTLANTVMIAVVLFSTITRPRDALMI